MKRLMTAPGALKLLAQNGRALFILLATVLAPTAAFAEDAASPGGIFEFGDFALQLPANAPAIRGIFLALGGPDTRAFVSDGSFGAPLPELEASLHVLGRELRALAAEQGLAVLGTSRRGLAELPNQSQTDELIFAAIGEAARISGRSELSGAPIFVYGISGGSPQAIGFTARNPARVGALLLKVPAPPERLTSAEALAVPTGLILAEREIFVDNTEVVSVFEFNRRAGGLWSLALEPGVPHHSLTPGQRSLTVNWLRAIVELRLGPSEQGPLRVVTESSGWLGHPDVGVADWPSFSGDRGTASWFPSRTAAEEWWRFIGGSDHR